MNVDEIDSTQFAVHILLRLPDDTSTDSLDQHSTWDRQLDLQTRETSN